MKLTKINEDSYFIRGGTNTGIVVFQDSSALAIDVGLSTARGKKISDCLAKEKIFLKCCIATHEHLDHYEAYTGVKESFPDCHFICPERSAPFIEIPELFYTYAYGGKPNKKLLGNTKQEIFDFSIDQRVTEGKLELGENFVEIVDLKGHSHGMAGVLTADRVLYLGDSLFDNNIMKKYEFPFLFNIEHFLESTEKIKNLDFDYGLIAHSKGAYSKEDINQLADKNADNVYKYLELVMEFLQHPQTRENLLGKIIAENEFDFNYKEYHYYYSALGSMLSYLYDRDQIDFKLENGLLYYYNR